MPTTVTRTIGSGRDHASISAWVDWCATNYSSGLVSADVILRGVIYAEGGGTNGEWSLSSTPSQFALTCDSTRYYLLETASGESFYDDANKLTNALRYNTANGVAIAVSGNYNALISCGTSSRVVVRGLQVNCSSARFTDGTGSGFVRFERCILKSSRNTSAFSEIAEAVNCVIHLTDAAGFVQGTNADNKSWRNCTIYGAGATNAFSYANYATGNVIANSAIFGFSGIVNNTARITTSSSVNIATDLSSVGWTGGSGAHVTSLTGSNQFTSLTSGSEDFRLKAGNSIATSGARDQSNTGDLDIIGSSRSTSTPSIGAWEYLAPAPNAPTGVTVGSITPFGATVSWTDASSDETGFKVQTAPSPYTSWTTASGSPTSANATSLAVTGLTDGTAYKARVASTNANGDSAWVESGIFTTVALTKLRPSATTSAGSWTATGAASLHAALSEASASDTEFISAASATTSKVKIANASSPGSTANHSFQFRAKGDGSTSLTVALVQGDPSETLIKSTTVTPGTSYALYTVTLTSGEAANITDYSALYFKFTSA
jgi:hypothetical protein